MTTCIHDLIPEWCAICNGADVEKKDEPLTFQGLIKDEVKPSSNFHTEGNDAKDL